MHNGLFEVKIVWKMIEKYNKVWYNNEKEKKMNKEDYILNEIGIDKAWVKLAIKFRRLLIDKEKKKEEVRAQCIQMIKDKEEIENGNNEIIKKYMGELDCE